MAMSLAKELELYECGWEPEIFEILLNDLFNSMCIDMSMEEFFSDRKDLSQYCDQVCQRVGKRIPDRVIIRRITNLRKANRLSS